MSIEKSITRINYNFQRNVNDLDKALRLNLDILIQNVSFDRASIFLYEEQQGIIYPNMIMTVRGEMEIEGEISLRENPESNFSIALIQNRQIAVSGYPEFGVFIPLINESIKIGVLRLDNFIKKRTLKKKDAVQAGVFAESFKQGIFNCLTYRRFHDQIKKLTTLTRIAGVMATALRMEEGLKVTLNSLVKDMGYDRAQVYLISSETNKITEGLRIDFRGQVKSRKDASDIYMSLNSMLTSKAPSFFSKKFSSDLIAYSPIYWKGSKIGFLVVDNLFSREFLKQEDLSFLGILANQLGILIENARLFEKVELSSLTDGLTGLYNHKHFYERLQEEISRAHRAGNKVSLLIGDLDHFKNFNDNYGHQAGDKTLMTIADLIRKNVRTIDIAARYGGEEFAIILPCADAADAKIIAKRILDDIRNSGIKIGQKTLKITMSVGGATYPDNSKEKVDLVKKADQALYWAKEHGRDAVMLYKDIKKE